MTVTVRPAQLSQALALIPFTGWATPEQIAQEMGQSVEWARDVLHYLTAARTDIDACILGYQRFPDDNPWRPLAPAQGRPKSEKQAAASKPKVPRVTHPKLPVGPKLPKPEPLPAPEPYLGPRGARHVQGVSGTLPGSAPTPSPFGELLRMYRERAGLSQTRLANITEGTVTSSFVNKLELGRNARLSRESTLALARALGLNEWDRDRLLFAAEFAPVIDWQTLYGNESMGSTEAPPAQNQPPDAPGGP